MKRYLVLGASGFIGSHLIPVLKQEFDEGDELIEWTRPFHPSLLAPSSLESITEIDPSHILHLAWGNIGTDYDLHSDSHRDWSVFTKSLIEQCIASGRKIWVLGTGLEDDIREGAETIYGEEKLKLKNYVLNLDSDFCSWISMPYVFSVFHRKPSILSDFLSQHSEFELRFPEISVDYLEVQDCAHQIARIVLREQSRLSKVSSRNTVTNSDFISRVTLFVQNNSELSCSCISGEDFPVFDDLFFTRRVLQ
jgi:nucleoside-diphosphate-sugar epimerase